jgi:hypothetical protein
LGRTIEEELDGVIQIPEVDESPYPIHDGFTSEDPTNVSLATAMEQGIARVVSEWRAGIRVFNSASAKPREVAEMEHDLAQHLSEVEGRACRFCEQQPCVWMSNHDSMLAWDELEHSDLPMEDVPAANIRRKKLHRQMAITMNGGPKWGKVSAFSFQNAWSMGSVRFFRTRTR